MPRNLTRFLRSAIPPDFSQIGTFAPEQVYTSSPVITSILNLLDAAMEEQFQKIPGLREQYNAFDDSLEGPFKQAVALQISPQLRFTFFRVNTGLPQSPRQFLQWLENPTLLLRTQSVEFRQELVLQTYINYIFVDPPFDPQYDNDFILSRKLLADGESPIPPRTAESVTAQFPFGQADSTCDVCGVSDDYKFAQPHAALTDGTAPDVLSISSEAMDPQLLAMLGGVQSGVQQQAATRERSALDIGPFTLPNIPTPREKLDATIAQIRTTIQDFLNLRLDLAVVPLSSAAATARFGTQYQQRLDGNKISIQHYGRFGFDIVVGAVRETARLVVTPSSSPFFIRLPPTGALLPFVKNFPKLANLLGVNRLSANASSAVPDSTSVAAPAPTSEAPAPAFEAPTPEAAPAPSPYGSRRLLQASPPSPPPIMDLETLGRVLAPPDELGLSVVAPILFPVALLPQWRTFFFDWRELFGIGNLFDPRIFNAALEGPYSKTTVLNIVPQFRIYLGQVKVGLPRSKNETETWLRDFREQLRTDELSFQLQFRVNFELNIQLRPIVPPRPPPRPPPKPPSPPSPPPPPKFKHWFGRRLLEAGEEAAPPQAEEAPHPTAAPWTTDDPRCAASNFPVLYDAASLAELRARQNGTVTINQWMEYMEAFTTGLEKLRTMEVLLECVPPLHREEAAAEAMAQAQAAAGAPAPSGGARKLQLSASAPPPSASLAKALAARAAAHLQLTDLKALFVQLRETVFGTAIFELVLFAQISEELNIQNIFAPLFNPVGIQKVARFQFDAIAGKEALFRLQVPKAPAKAPATTTPVISG